jgi:phospholipid transport system substrate-binding protein
MIQATPLVLTQRILLSLLTLLLLPMLLLAGGAARAQTTASDPEQLVRDITSQVMSAIENDAALKAGDRRKALALAEEKILPYVDFAEAARLAAGRSWNNATPEQRTRLTNEFRAMLVRTYSTAVDRYRGQKMEVLPAKVDPKATEASIRNRYLKPGAPPVTVIYSMRKVGDTWKIYDISVEGISLVLNYRSEFETIARDSGFDGLIARLAEKNKTGR